MASHEVIPILAALLGALCVLLVLKRLLSLQKTHPATPAEPEVQVDDDLW